ncbi:protein max-like isoform X1 [Macrosteles quadrilineatus]|uniref:protein max-like isoform X1 n=1 Tax=Macrosteles quadrilineatus TaxID=74068 RepID=UPI0023E0FCFF|nr:protein max-like isoform X1 [Macrosteles quadrilineatus]
MSDDDRDLDIESAEKRAHHNALERKRRDHIKDSFSSLRDSVPSLQGEKVVRNCLVVPSLQGEKGASRAQILKKAADYIQFMRRKNSAHQQDIDDLKRQNMLLEAQIRTLEKTKATGNYAADQSELVMDNGYGHHDSESDTSDSDSTRSSRKTKKLKVSGMC